MQTKYFGLFFLGVLLFLAACEAEPAGPLPSPTLNVVAEGLLGPIGLAALPDGGLLIAEEGTGQFDESAGVSLLTAGGEIGRFISGLPSRRDAGDLAGVNVVALTPNGRSLLIGNFGQGHLWQWELPDGPLQLPDTPLTSADLTPLMRPLNNVQLTNPFAITFDPEGVPVVSDASQNGVATLNPDGTTRFIHRFAPLTDPANPLLSIDPVPTGIARVGDEYFVTLLGGCPYPEGSGQLVAIDTQRNQRVVRDGLNMPIDVAVGPDGVVWLLEFARFTAGASCFSGEGYQQHSGRLSRVAADGGLEVVLDGLNFPGAVLPMPDGSLYLTEVFHGRVLHVTFGAAAEVTAPELPTAPLAQATPVYREIEDWDAALTAVIRTHALRPNPGQEQKADDTPLAQLGRDLFFDPILSGDLNIACATCHHPALSMGDGRVLPIGTGGDGLGPARDFLEQVALASEATTPRLLRSQATMMGGEPRVANPFLGAFVPRNSPTILNSALLPVQFWDGRVKGYGVGEETAVFTLERAVNQLNLNDPLTAQALFPLTSLHEMAGATLGHLPPADIRRHLAQRVSSLPPYAERFAAIFESDEVTPLQIALALAEFERRLIFTDAPWDAYLRGDRAALTEPQKRGALLFYSELNPQVNCAQCHSGDLFTDLSFHNILAPQLGPGKGHGNTGREDWGRGGVTFDLRDQYKFRTPPLRNVALTAPYLHSGAYASLEEVIWHHANVWESAANYDPGRHLPPSFYSSLRPFDWAIQGRTVAPALRDGLPLSRQDVADLVAFLHSLTDPAAANLAHFLPESVPSGLPLDPPLPPEAPTVHRPIAETTNAAASGGLTTPGELRFRDVAPSVGLNFQHGAFRTAVSPDPVAAMSGGLCWIDYDQDGWLDLYVVNNHALAEIGYWEAQGGLPRNALFRNVRGTFVEVGAAAGVDVAIRGNGCVAADLNGDGWPDLYVTADGPNLLFWNNGDGTFTEGAAAAGVDAPEWNSAAAVGDLNGDGLPDLFVAAFIDLDKRIPNPSGAFPQDYFGLPDRLYLHEGIDPATGRATFREVTLETGLQREERTLGALLTDVNRNGRLDLYLANDGQPNRLYENTPTDDGLGFRLVDLTGSADVGDSGSGMGVAGGDYDNDGWFDLFVTNWEVELNALYRNTTHEAGFINFRYSTYRIGLSGLGNNQTGWGTTWADFDHDSDLDLLVVNGRVPVTNMETDPELVRLYGNMLAAGQPGQFRDWTAGVGLDEVGPLLARGSAVADFNNDGLLDVAINSIGGPLVLLQSSGARGNWLQIGFDGFYPGVVAFVTLADGRQLARELHVGSSYLASEETRLHFGLGETAVIPHLLIQWPGGRETRLRDVPANQRLILAPGE